MKSIFRILIALAVVGSMLLSFSACLGQGGGEDVGGANDITDSNENTGKPPIADVGTNE